jgi:flagellar biosynthesis protein FlhF
MRIKRFEAPDNQTALKMVKKEMGDEALILATRTLTPAERKNGSNIRVEVVAAIDSGSDNKGAPDTEHENNMSGNQNTYDYSIVRRGNNLQSDIPQEILSKKYAPNTDSTKRDRPDNLANNTDKNIATKDIQQRLLQFMKKPDSGDASTEKHPEQNTPDRSVEKPSPEAVAKWRNQLIEQIQIKPPRVNNHGHSPAILALVGATGVGKTTTAAKLAAWYTLREGLKVTLLSMDCYRIGATDQLRTYSKIMRLPCEVALRQKDFANAIKRHQNQDVIIIDTAGKSPYNNSHINELAEWFGPVGGIQAHLVLSATTKKEDIAHSIKSYEPLSTTGLMITKLDETRAYATLCQQIAASSKPVSCISTGQRVPEDFMMASKEFLDILFREGWNAATAEAGAA